jgi:hypothetical protein
VLSFAESTANPQLDYVPGTSFSGNKPATDKKFGKTRVATGSSGKKQLND